MTTPDYRMYYPERGDPVPVEVIGNKVHQIVIDDRGKPLDKYTGRFVPIVLAQEAAQAVTETKEGANE